MSKPTKSRRKPKSRALGPLYLWRVEGGEVGSSSGGSTTFLVATGSATALPDVHAGIREVSRGRYSLYDVDRVEQVGCLYPDDAAWLEAPGDPRTHPELDDWSECADQTGYGLAASDIRRLAVQILHEAGPVTPTPTKATPVAPTQADPSLAKLHRNSPELLSIARSFASQLEDALRLVPACCGSRAGVPCIRCEITRQYASVSSVIDAIELDL